jgi:hypothetical protein
MRIIDTVTRKDYEYLREYKQELLDRGYHATIEKETTYSSGPDECPVLFEKYNLVVQEDFVL